MQMQAYLYETPQTLLLMATDANFDEACYLRANPDVAAAVRARQFNSGRQHFEVFGRQEGRRLQLKVEPGRKRSKLQQIRRLFRDDMEMRQAQGHFDFLTPELREEFGIIDTTAISSNGYDPDALALIERHRNGIVLDCGAGSRDLYFQNVVNFEIADYDSTDVRGVGEALPFKADSFDGVLSLAVLEHVKDPWRCAQEIMRVLKPGGDLICCVPFLQPVHGYPHHYYNMTEQGLRNLFCSGVDIVRHEVPVSTLPIWTLTWILNCWASGLDEKTRQEFVNLRVADLMAPASTQLSKGFVTQLTKEKNMELASATVLHGKKRPISRVDSSFGPPGG
jgi:SAM-dependent methyltransferase